MTILEGELLILENIGNKPNFSKLERGTVLTVTPYQSIGQLEERARG